MWNWGNSTHDSKCCQRGLRKAHGVQVWRFVGVFRRDFGRAQARMCLAGSTLSGGFNGFSACFLDSLVAKTSVLLNPLPFLIYRSTAIPLMIALSSDGKRWDSTWVPTCRCWSRIARWAFYNAHALTASVNGLPALSVGEVEAAMLSSRRSLDCAPCGRGGSWCRRCRVRRSVQPRS